MKICLFFQIVYVVIFINKNILCWKNKIFIKYEKIRSFNKNVKNLNIIGDIFILFVILIWFVIFVLYDMFLICNLNL